MVSNKPHQPLAPVALLASLLMEQRGERPNQRALTTYSAALSERAYQLLVEQKTTGAELFQTIPRQDGASWEDIPYEEQSLHNAVMQDCN